MEKTRSLITSIDQSHLLQSIFRRSIESIIIFNRAKNCVQLIVVARPTIEFFNKFFAIDCQLDTIAKLSDEWIVSRSFAAFNFSNGSKGCDVPRDPTNIRGQHKMLSVRERPSPFPGAQRFPENSMVYERQSE